MKRLILLIILLLLCIVLFAPISGYVPIMGNQALRDDTLLRAIIQVESKGRPDAVNWKENALGLLQIRDVMLVEINRILEEQGKDTRYTHRDCLDSTKSIKMYYLVMDYYNPSYDVFKGCTVWNGRSAKHKYYYKVKQQLINI